jgi:hypothetical protein
VVAAQRDLLGTVLEANMAVLSVEQAKISNRQNATMERLILASIFLPLTFVTGFFGQNFGWLVGHITTFCRVHHLRDRRPGGAAGHAVVVAQAPPDRPGPRHGRRAVTRSRARPKVRGS